MIGGTSMTSGVYEGLSDLISFLLLCFIVAVAGYLWLVDLFSEQRAFGLLLGAVLFAFSMLIYVYTKPSYGEISKPLLILGYLALTILLSLSIAVSLGYAT
jgi:hypothetical protein